jgi:hypothetical protein
MIDDSSPDPAEIDLRMVPLKEPGLQMIVVLYDILCQNVTNGPELEIFEQF